jgi:sterol desaturase/sphingolipid hydroxylase (fatty acid hydroxylase superfamily)
MVPGRPKNPNPKAAMHLVLDLLSFLGETMMRVLPVTLGIAVVFSVLSHFWALNPGTPWWRKRELFTDALYWFFIPIMARFVRITFLVIGAAFVFGIQGDEALIAFYDNGHGPLATLPLWAQALVFLVVSDFMLYWVHRLFHGNALWKYHAIHHSSEEVDWISAARFHPVNLIFGSILVDVVLLLAGISPNVMLWIGPFTTAHSAFVHANLNWSFGPLRYVIATPVFHHWHHEADAAGCGSNFAGTFPVWDMMFGTYYWPQDKLPSNYGAADPQMPSGFLAQLVYPFRQ